MRFIMSEIIAITGHRDYTDPAALYRGLNTLKADVYLFGGARGTDCDALEYIAKTKPGSIRTVVVPNRLIDQPGEAQITIKRHATNVIELHNTGRDRYFIRNQYLVDHSTRVHAFYDFRGTGGTYQTIEYARSTGKEVEIWRLYPSDLNEFMRLDEQEFWQFLKDMRGSNVNLCSVKGIAMEYCKRKFGGVTPEFAQYFRAWESGL